MEDLRNRPSAATAKPIRSPDAEAKPLQLGASQSWDERDHDTFKSRICKFWLHRDCWNGTRCHYAHGRHEITKEKEDMKKVDEILSSLWKSLPDYIPVNRSTERINSPEEDMRNVDEVLSSLWKSGNDYIPINCSAERINSSKEPSYNAVPRDSNKRLSPWDSTRGPFQEPLSNGIARGTFQRPLSDTRRWNSEQPIEQLEYYQSLNRAKDHKLDNLR